MRLRPGLDCTPPSRMSWDSPGRRTSADSRTAPLPKILIFNAEPFLNNGSSFDYCANRSEAKVFCRKPRITSVGRATFCARMTNLPLIHCTQFRGSMGRVSMSANDPDNMVIYTHGDSSRVFFTVDGGASWNLSAGRARGHSGWLFPLRPPAGGRPSVTRHVLLLRSVSVGSYLSEDGGASFTLASSSLPTNVPFDSYELKARPDAAGEVWASLDAAGLYRSVDKGRSFYPRRDHSALGYLWFR